MFSTGEITFNSWWLRFTIKRWRDYYPHDLWKVLGRRSFLKTPHQEFDFVFWFIIFFPPHSVLWAELPLVYFNFLLGCESFLVIGRPASAGATARLITGNEIITRKSPLHYKHHRYKTLIKQNNTPGAASDLLSQFRLRATYRQWRAISPSQTRADLR